MESKDRIDFLGIGAAKSGTTWLSHHLSRHSQIFLPQEKELHYFNPFDPENSDKPNVNKSRNLEWYHGFFQNIGGKRIIGEYSTSYLKYADSAKAIANYNKNIKLMVLLRSPIDRAFSHYRFLLQRGFISNVSFAAARASFPGIIHDGFYAKQLDPFFDSFPRNQIFVAWFDDILENPEQLYSNALKFLGVDYEAPRTPLSEKINPGKDVAFKNLNRVLDKTKEALKESRIGRAGIEALKKVGVDKGVAGLKNANTKSAPESLPGLNKTEREELLEIYLKDIVVLEKKFAKDLSKWKA